MNKKSHIHANHQTLSTWVSSLLLFCWLFSSNLTVTHVQEHALLDEHNCQLCFVVENSSSEAAAHQQLSVKIAQFNSEIDAKPPKFHFISRIFLSNSDPP